MSHRQDNYTLAVTPGKKRKKKKNTPNNDWTRACALKRCTPLARRRAICSRLLNSNPDVEISFRRLRSLAPSFTFLGKLSGRFSCRHIHGVRVKRRMRKDEREMDAQILFYVFFFFMFLILSVVGGESPRKTRWRLEQ